MLRAKFFQEYLRREYGIFFSDASFQLSFLFGFFAILLASVINYFAGLYATLHASAPVSDLILSNVRRIDTSFFHALGLDAINIFVASLVFIFPRRAPFLLKSLAFLVVVRAAFINMTYLGIYPDAVPLTGSLMTFGGDLFFSGHVGIMFLVALIFWDIFLLRYFFLLLAVFFGSSALLGHFHYSIDVFAAPFIGYGIFKLSEKFFKRDFVRMGTSLHINSEAAKRTMV